MTTAEEIYNRVNGKLYADSSWYVKLFFKIVKFKHLPNCVKQKYEGYVVPNSSWYHVAADLKILIRGDGSCVITQPMTGRDKLKSLHYKKQTSETKFVF